MTVVRPVEPDELPELQAIELAAGARFRAIDDERIARCADHPPMPIEALAEYVAEGRALAAVDDGGPVGFVVFEVVDGCAHIEEVAVRADAGGQGHGSVLLEAVASWAREAGLPGITLTTFDEVPWNRPLYERRGFRVLDESEITDGLRAKVAEEATFGLVPETRVVMRRELS